MDNAFTAQPLADVDARPAERGEGWTLVFVRDLRHPPTKVWGALTNPEKVRDWAPYAVDRDLGQPGDATLTMIDAEVAQDSPPTVRIADEPTLLEYSFGTDLLRWELEPTPTGTRLTLRHTVADRHFAPTAATRSHSSPARARN